MVQRKQWFTDVFCSARRFQRALMESKGYSHERPAFLSKSRLPGTNFFCGFFKGIRNIWSSLHACSLKWPQPQVFWCLGTTHSIALSPVAWVPWAVSFHPKPSGLVLYRCWALGPWTQCEKTRGSLLVGSSWALFPWLESAGLGGQTISQPTASGQASRWLMHVLVCGWEEAGNTTAASLAYNGCCSSS